ncbi:MAG: MBL fold metallo-hydrolase [Pseudomonadales bacterium]|jgi:glyoxylase-like metal-dependent hydrolase (beta-lactamase superfamily II)|nr:MBL fold metallo-hydrolase [Pseudomonadales bacterium]
MSTTALGVRPYERGLAALGDGTWAWLQPDGSWGWSNAGLVVDGEETLLVDTLYDLALTGEMLDAMRASVPAAHRIGRLVNTHANGDHCNGNALVGDAEIVASAACAEEMRHEDPAAMAAMKARAHELGDLGEFFLHCFGAFDFEGIEQRLPTRTFEHELTLSVGDKAVELYQVGPAHTRGDVLVHVPADRVVYTGDILFIEGHPILWAGPVGNWLAACDRIAAFDPELVVPGHGPVTDLRGVRAVRDYLVYLRDEARARYDAGLSAREAARDIALDDYDGWGDAERIAVNVATLYREFSGDASAPNVPELFGLMTELWKDRGRRGRRPGPA